jgi:hypothetical protein
MTGLICARKCFEQSARLDRLVEASGHASFAAFARGLFRGISRERNNGHALLPQNGKGIKFGCIKPVHHRHVEIHQSKIKGLLQQSIHRPVAIFNHHDLMAALLQHLAQNHLVGAIVFRHKNTQRPCGQKRHRRKIFARCLQIFEQLQRLFIQWRI